MSPMPSQPTPPPQLPMTLAVSTWKKILSVLGGLLLGAIGALLAFGAATSTRNDRATMGIIGVVFVATAIWMCLSAPRVKLHLTAEGFSLESPGRPWGRKNRRWIDVGGEFFVVVVRRNGIPVEKLIGWRHAPEFKKQTLLRKLNGLGGWDDSIPGAFGGMKADDLADLMNRIRAERVGARAA